MGGACSAPEPPWGARAYTRARMPPGPVLVTGATGAIGSRVVEALARAGKDVVAVGGRSRARAARLRERCARLAGARVGSVAVIAGDAAWPSEAERMGEDAHRAGGLLAFAAAVHCLGSPLPRRARGARGARKRARAASVIDADAADDDDEGGAEGGDDDEAPPVERNFAADFLARRAIQARCVFAPGARVVSVGAAATGARGALPAALLARELARPRDIGATPARAAAAARLACDIWVTSLQAAARGDGDGAGAGGGGGGDSDDAPLSAVSAYGYDPGRVDSPARRRQAPWSSLLLRALGRLRPPLHAAADIVRLVLDERCAPGFYDASGQRYEPHPFLCDPARAARLAVLADALGKAGDAGPAAEAARGEATA